MPMTSVMMSIGTGRRKYTSKYNVLKKQVLALKEERRVVVLYRTQGSAATHLRCGGIFSDDVITNFLLILTVKEFLKPVNI